MKKVLFALAIVGFSTAAIAQTQRTPEQTSKFDAKKAEMQKKRAVKQEAHFAKMKSDLNLNDAQVTKIRAMQAEMKSNYVADKQKHMEMKKVAGANKKAKKEAMTTEMKTILSPEQYQKWDAQRMANQEKRKAKMQDRKGKMKQMKMERRNATAS